MTAPKVSIIIPCYNTGEIINETFQSLENQTNKNFEVIFINDGSIDNTLKRLQDFKKRSSLLINIIDKKNGGVSAARNDGIGAAKGKYLTFLDSDDIYHEDFIDTMLNAVESYDADVVYCRLTRNFSKLSVREKIFSIELPDEAMNRLLFQMGEYGFCCYLYRTDILRLHNILFDEHTRYGEDREFIWKYLINCQSFVNINSIMYGYRENPKSATQKKASWRRTDSLQAVKRVEQYMIEHKVSFYPVYKDYMYARDMWAVAKNFAITGAKECFNRLMKEYDVKSCMKRTVKDANKLVALASGCYLMSPKIFYFLIKGCCHRRNRNDK